ncbi:MAG: toxin-antitoxin system YwqK family antitoxin [Phycisphaerales bacterium]
MTKSGIVLALLAAAAAVAANSTLARYEPASFSADRDGNRSGTGTKDHEYKSGELMLREHYVRGLLVRSEWFKPDGTPIQTTRWQWPETGEVIFLRQDGSIRRRMACVNGVAHGESVFYRDDGTVERRAMYREGQPVEP